MSPPPTNMTADSRTRHELLALLSGRNAHMTVADATADFPPQHINSRSPAVPYTFWHLVEHIRIAQSDILDFIRNPQYQSLDWPASYWPDPAAEASVDMWQQSLTSFGDDQEQLALIIQDPQVDLLAELPHAPGYTIYREILLAADHNAYHTGELAILRQVMGLWREETSGVL